MRLGEGVMVSRAQRRKQQGKRHAADRAHSSNPLAEPPDFDPANDPDESRRAAIRDPLKPDPRFARVAVQVMEPRFGLVRIEGQTFRAQQVFVDGRRFVRCSFVGCVLVTFVGRFVLEDCDIVQAAIAADGPASSLAALIRREAGVKSRFEGPADRPKAEVATDVDEKPDLVSLTDIRVEQAILELRELPYRRHVDAVFRDQDVYLDGRSFANCRFERCRMIVMLGWFEFQGNQTVDHCSWHIGGPARTAIRTLEQIPGGPVTDLDGPVH